MNRTPLMLVALTVAQLASGCGGDKDCYSLTIDACENTYGCALEEARPWRDSAMCYGPREAAYCRPAEVICSNIIITATDPNGACWIFNAACGDEPAGWTFEWEGTTCDPDIGNTCE